MAITVITHGQKPKFKKTCPNCGCVFEHENEDLRIDYSWDLNSLSYTYPRRLKRYVVCPDCGEHLYHDTIIDPTYVPTYPNITYTNGTNWPDCDKCPNKPDPTKITIGDTPCTWCVKNRPYCTTGVTSATSAPNDVKITVSGNSPKIDFNNLHASNTTTYSDEAAEDVLKKLTEL